MSFNNNCTVLFFSIKIPNIGGANLGAKATITEIMVVIF